MINDIYDKILNNIPLQTHIKYIPTYENDGEQMTSIFYKKKYPYIYVCKYWYLYYKNNNILISKI